MSNVIKNNYKKHPRKNESTPEAKGIIKMTQVMKKQYKSHVQKFRKASEIRKKFRNKRKNRFRNEG